MATSVAQGQLLCDAVAQYGIAVLVGHHRAHSAIMAQARAVVASGRLGRLVSVVGSATFYKPDRYFAEAPWRSAPGGGPILINMIHEVHNLRILCGEVVAVQAIASNAVRGHAVEDTVSIGLQFASGALGSFMLSDTAASARSWEQTSQENKAYSHYADEDCYVVSGTLGSLSVPTMRLKTYATGAPRSWQAPFECSVADAVRNDPLVQQMAHFAALIRGEAAPLVSVYGGLANQKVIEAIAAAASSGQTIAIAGA